MGCGCGKAKVQRNTPLQNTIKQVPASAGRTEAAKAYQSATMQIPRGPVGTARKTV